MRQVWGRRNGWNDRQIRDEITGHTCELKWPE